MTDALPGLEVWTPSPAVQRERPNDAEVRAKLKILDATLSEYLNRVAYQAADGIRALLEPL